jgi:putative ABC transport system ATP-binding protein
MMFQLNHVWRTYRVGDMPVIALRDANLEIGAAEFISLAGPSGSGKSTMLQMIGLLDRPSYGSIMLDSRDTAVLNDDERSALRLRTIGFVFQRFHLLSGLTALENVTLPMEAAGMAPAERYARARKLLAQVGLADRLDFWPAQLSGGQRQRVAIARALANDPPFILADEPTGELHSEDKRSVLALFEELHEQGHTIIVVTHDPEVAAVAGRRLEMRDGRLKEVPA